VNGRATTIRLLKPEDAPAFVSLRREALEAAPLAFAASPEDDRGLSEDFMRPSIADADEAAVFGAFEGDRLAGIAGVGRYAKRKQRHRAIIWGMYVSTDARGRGFGRALLDAAVNRAREWPGVRQIHLSVTDAAPGARRLYESAGFREWGVEPRSLEAEGRAVSEHHLVLELD
jgi:RimJ/RimL family protein N-acetyltransferase